MTQPQPHLTVESMCRLAGVSRAGFYRRFLKREPRPEEVELRAEMQRIVHAHRHRYGYRRVTTALRAEGWAVNRKRIARLMRDDNLLEEHGMVASMSRPGNPYDNAQCESFMKPLKQEEIHTRGYRDLPHLEAHIGNFLDRSYNRMRLHSALGYRTPEDFERSLPAQPASAPVVTLSFPRHHGIDRPEEMERTGERL